MNIVADGNNIFKLLTLGQTEAGLLSYENCLFQKGTIHTETELQIENTATGIWKSFLTTGTAKIMYAELKVSTGSTIAIKFSGRKSKYRFKRTGGWKARFILLNKDGEELIALLPQINWQKKTYEFTLQVNDEYKEECTPVLILHTLHSACCSLNMLNGAVPALINV